MRRTAGLSRASGRLRTGPRGGRLPRSAVCLSAIGIAVLAVIRVLDTSPAALPDSLTTAATDLQQPSARLDAAYRLALAPMSLGSGDPLSAAFAWSEPTPAAAPPAEAEIVLPPAAPVSALVQSVPLPTPRPADLAARAEPDLVRAPPRLAMARRRAPVAAAAPADNRSLFEKLFGIGQPSGPVLAYAAPETSVLSNARRAALVPAPGSAGGTAVYDITAHTVTMPDGTRLEAHSGFGDKLDDPRHVHVRMRGPTPPQVYDLRLREQLFHGVRALRLTPVGGGGTFGRNGLLAHTYMLGPRGDSNGCVSFKDYDAFLKAYLNGDVRRLVVVARQT